MPVASSPATRGRDGGGSALVTTGCGGGSAAWGGSTPV